jgi:glycine cleavage system H protein
MTVRFTREHEWIRIEGQSGTVGITDFAQKQLGDIVYVELPVVGRSLKQGAEAGIVESVKAASEIYAPMSGEVTAINDALAADPGRVNASALGEGWMFKMTLSDPDEATALMEPKAYQDYLDTLD